MIRAACTSLKFAVVCHVLAPAKGLPVTDRVFDTRLCSFALKKQMSTPAAQTSLLLVSALCNTFLCARRAVCGEGPKAGGAGAEGAAEVLASDQQPEGGAVPGRAGGDPGDDAGALALQILLAGAVPLFTGCK